ncbi:MAG TPA: RES family NAD+ phosphorylase [Myxococcales bacterium]
MKVWRIGRARHAPTGSAAFGGEGGLSFDGRWHSRGKPIVYTASTESLAKLEALVHYQPILGASLVVIEATLPDDLVAALATALPAGWDAVPDTGAARPIGDAWLTSASSLALEVPSLHSAAEKNVLINPGHPDFSQIRIGPPKPFSFDPRLLDPRLRR